MYEIGDLAVVQTSVSDVSSDGGLRYWSGSRPVLLRKEDHGNLSMMGIDSSWRLFKISLPCDKGASKIITVLVNIVSRW